MSVRTDILDAMITALGGVGKPTGLVVDRYRTTPTTAALAITLYPVEESSARVGQNRGPLTQHTLRVRLECRVQNGGAPDVAIDPVLTWAIQALWADESLGGRVNELAELGVTWDAETFENQYTVAWLDVSVRYATAAGNPTTQP